MDECTVNRLRLQWSKITLNIGSTLACISWSSSKQGRHSLVAPDWNQISVSQCHGGLFTDGKRRLEGCRWWNEAFIYHTVINLKIQAVAVGAGSPCLVPTARQRCRHPGAISEIADLSRSLPFFCSFVLSRLTLQQDSFRSGRRRFVCCLWQSLTRLALITLMLHWLCRQEQ